MRRYSAAITVEFQASSLAMAEARQRELASLVYSQPDVVYADTIGPPVCFEECDESEEG